MKNILLLVMVIFFSGLASAGITECNRKTSEEKIFQEYKNFAFIERDVPQGACDFLGLLKNGKTAMDCRQVAEEKGYKCFQITEYRKGYGGELYHRTEKNCFACL